MASRFVVPPLKIMRFICLYIPFAPENIEVLLIGYAFKLQDSNVDLLSA